MGLFAAHGVVVFLTVFLVALNVRATVLQYMKDQNNLRAGAFLATLVIAGSLIITISFIITSRVIESEAIVREGRSDGVPRYGIESKP